jgi:hypothetical protein
MVPSEEELNTSDLENLRQKLNDEDYLTEAIQRIAQVLSNELLDSGKPRPAR